MLRERYLILIIFQTIQHEYLGCPHFRGIVLTLSAALWMYENVSLDDECPFYSPSQ